MDTIYKNKLSNSLQKIGLYFFFLILISCGDKSKTPVTQPPADCTITSQNQYVFDLMNDFYYWYDKVPSVDPSTYSSPEELLEALKYSTLDRFSGIIDQQSYSLFLGQGKFIGIGLRLFLDNNNRLFVALAYSGSPAANAGIVRGTEIIAINGYMVSTLLSGADFDNAWGDTSLGTSATLDIILPGSNTTTTATMVREVVTIDSTQIVDTFTDSNGTKFGYLLFTNFFAGATSTTPLNQAFSFFQSENIEQLILDLRYNGGGAVQTATHLGGLIGGIVTENQVFTSLLYSDRYSHFNSNTIFQDKDESLNLNKIYIITTPATCSASEMLINSLSPHIEVVTIGNTTCGKPVGFNPQNFCDKTISAVNFEFRNSLNIGEFYSGLLATCTTTDDLLQPLGSIQENAISIASFYQQNNQCPTGTADHIRLQHRWHEIESSRIMDMQGIY